jgi:hypothetical protein
MQRRKQAVLATGAIGALLFLALLATLAFRPALVLGLDGDTLAHSVDSRVQAAENSGRCKHREDSSWLCNVMFEPDVGSGGGYVVYEVDADGFGCWRAVRPAHSPRMSMLAAKMHGCIYLWDF